MRVESLKSEGIPGEIVALLKERGIETLTPPQEQAIRAGLLKGRNILVTAPTASGKTLVGELALLKTALEGRIGVYVTPLKTLASEKHAEFSFWRKAGISVGISTGDYDEPGEWLGRHDIIVATYERFDSILRLKPSWLTRVGALVIDEMHMIGDRDRGPIVELIAVRSSRMGVQLIGLSATIGNPEELAEWLGAELVVSEWRPVRLVEGFYRRRRGEIVFSDGRVEKVRSKDIIRHSLYKALSEDYQILVFLQSRRRAEAAAEAMSRLTPPAQGAEDIVRRLKEGSPRSEAESLVPLVRKGVAYHHAGLSMNARKAVEDGFRAGVLRAVAATPTLAAGINMPARRVIVFTRRYSGGRIRPISIAEYKQMAGRAGRPQYDPYGEAVVADVKSDEEGWRYVRGRPEDVSSSLISERAMRIHVLSLIASGDAGSMRSLLDIMKGTLAYRQLGEEVGEDSVTYTLEELIDMGMVGVNGVKLSPTRLGACVSRLYLDPLTAVVVIGELKGTSEDVPPTYYFTLIAMTPDFSRVRVVGYRRFEEEANAALEYGHIPGPVVGVGYFEWLKAYKVARILHEWIDEVPEDQILERYGIGSGDLGTLTETAEWLTYASARLCWTAGLAGHSRKLFLLSKRVKYGVKEDLLELTSVRGIGRVRARVLYSAGIKSVSELAKANPARIAALPGFGRRIAKEVVEEARKIAGVVSD